MLPYNHGSSYLVHSLIDVHIYAYVTFLNFTFMVLLLSLFSEFFFSHNRFARRQANHISIFTLVYIVEMIVCEFLNKDSLFTNGGYDSLRANPLWTSKTGFGQVKIMKEFVGINRKLF